MKIIKLTANFNVNRPRTHYFVVDKIEHVSPKDEGQGAIISMPTHNKGGYHVAESPEDVVRLMRYGPYVE